MGKEYRERFRLPPVFSAIAYPENKENIGAACKRECPRGKRKGKIRKAIDKEDKIVYDKTRFVKHIHFTLWRWEDEAEIGGYVSAI